MCDVGIYNIYLDILILVNEKILNYKIIEDDDNYYYVYVTFDQSDCITRHLFRIIVHNVPNISLVVTNKLYDGKL